MTKPIRPDDLKALAGEAEVSAAWVERAKAALIEAADACNWVEVQRMDDETAAHAVCD
jgi:hypothetical protein